MLNDRKALRGLWEMGGWQFRFAFGLTGLAWPSRPPDGAGSSPGKAAVKGSRLRSKRRDHRKRPGRWPFAAGRMPGHPVCASRAIRTVGSCRGGCAVIEHGTWWRNLRVGAENLVALCDLGVSVNQPAKPVPAQHADSGHFRGWMCAPGGRVLLQGPVRPVGPG